MECSFPGLYLHSCVTTAAGFGDLGAVLGRKRRRCGRTLRVRRVKAETTRRRLLPAWASALRASPWISTDVFRRPIAWTRQRRHVASVSLATAALMRTRPIALGALPATIHRRAKSPPRRRNHPHRPGFPAGELARFCAELGLVLRASLTIKRRSCRRRKRRGERVAQ